MKTEELNLVLDGQNYLFRLTPKKIKKRGKNRASLAMILDEVDLYIKETGELEVKIFAGENMNDWEKIGTYREDYTNNSIQDFGKRLTDLNIGNKKILVDEYYHSEGTYSASAVIQQRKNWHSKWENIFAGKAVVNRDDE